MDEGKEIEIAEDSIVLLPVSFENSVLTFEVVNNTGEAITYGYDYSLQKKVNGEYKLVKYNGLEMEFELE